MTKDFQKRLQVGERVVIFLRLQHTATHCDTMQLTAHDHRDRHDSGVIYNQENMSTQFSKLTTIPPPLCLNLFRTPLHTTHSLSSASFYIPVHIHATHRGSVLQNRLKNSSEKKGWSVSKFQMRLGWDWGWSWRNAECCQSMSFESTVRAVLMQIKSLCL